MRQATNYYLQYCNHLERLPPSPCPRWRNFWKRCFYALFTLSFRRSRRLFDLDGVIVKIISIKVPREYQLTTIGEVHQFGKSSQKPQCNVSRICGIAFLVLHPIYRYDFQAQLFFSNVWSFCTIKVLDDREKISAVLINLGRQEHPALIKAYQGLAGSCLVTKCKTIGKYKKCLL